MSRILLVLAILALNLSCTPNQMAKNMGGTMTVELGPGQKLVLATWKEDHLWYLTRPMREGETPETSTFSEKSSSGFMEGTVVFIER